MRVSSRILGLVPLFFLLGFACMAAVAIYNTQSLSLPISTVTAAFTLILPLAIGLVSQGTRFLDSHARRSLEQPNENPFNLRTLAIITFFVIYETVIATIATSHMTSPSDSRCRLEDRWSWLFVNKRATEIRRIQDRHQCCGLHSNRDRAWPFPDATHTAEACYQAFGRLQSCFESWKRDETVTATLILLVAILCFLYKLVLLILNRRRPTVRPSLTSALPGPFSGAGDLEGTTRRGINDAYHDDPLPIDDQDDSDRPSSDEENRRQTSTGVMM